MAKAIICTGGGETNLNELKIDGVNLVLFSKPKWYLHLYTTNNDAMIQYDLSKDFIEGKVYTISFKGSKTEGVFSISNDDGASFILENIPYNQEKELYEGTFAYSPLSGEFVKNKILQICNNQVSTPGGEYPAVELVKLEEGSIATAWSPAPEDIEIQLEEVRDENTVPGTYFNTYVPTLDNLPASDWIDGTSKYYLGNIFYDLSDGCRSYRWSVKGQAEYYWHREPNSNLLVNTEFGDGWDNSWSGLNGAVLRLRTVNYYETALELDTYNCTDDIGYMVQSVTANLETNTPYTLSARIFVDSPMNLPRTVIMMVSPLVISESFVAQPGWNDLSFTFQIETLDTTPIVGIGAKKSEGGGATLYVYHPKLEKGSLATGWCP